MVTLDSLHMRILEHLQRDGRMTLSELARRTERGESTVRERLIALERAGVIESYRAVLHPARLGLKARAIVRADCDVANVAQVGRRLSAIPNVVSCVMTTGSKPMRIELVAEDVETLTRVLETRVAAPDLLNLETGFVLEELVPLRGPPMPALAPPGAIPERAPAGSDVPKPMAPYVPGPRMNP